jgi:hydroxyacylglutathione hydrolase
MQILSLAVALAIAGCATQRHLVRQAANQPLVVQLDVGSGTNAFVIMGERPILVDTGWGDSPEALEEALADVGVRPDDLALVVLTHGHGDHAGGAAWLRTVSRAPLVSHAADVEMLAAGHNRELVPMSFLGRMLHGLSDQPFPPVAPDILVDAQLDLRPYGVEGTVVAVPGHTPGSLAILLPGGDAVVGDMVRGGLLSSTSPARHFFHDDCTAAEGHLAELIERGARRLYVGHGGPLDAQEAVEVLREDPCP